MVITKAIKYEILTVGLQTEKQAILRYVHNWVTFPFHSY
jgi:hypothetical protein